MTNLGSYSISNGMSAMKWIGFIAGCCAFAVQAGEVHKAMVDFEEGIYSIEVDAQVAVAEPKVRAWLTDYAHLDRVNPAILSSDILETRGPGDLTVRTITNACVWIFCIRIHQVQTVVESDDGSVLAVVIPEQSDFKQGFAKLELAEKNNGTRVHITAEVEPDFWIPPIIGPWLIKRKLRTETLETVQNLEHLDALK